MFGGFTRHALFATALLSGLPLLTLAAPSEKEPSMELSSPAFQADQRIPSKYTTEGQDLSPPLRWDHLPEGTRGLALIVDDPDAPRDEPFVHWVIYRVPASARGLPEHVPQPPQVKNPGGAVQGKNSFGDIGYRGPAPPAGHGTHHYHFKLYAVDTPLSLEAGASKAQLLDSLEGHVLGRAELVGTYER